MKELDPRWMDTKFRQEMGFHHLRIGVLVQEVELQCKFILMADAQLRCAGSSDEAWYAIQALLVAAANVSKSAWAGGSRMTPKEIALSRQLTAELRKALDLDGS